MKMKILTVICYICCLLFFFVGCDKRSERAKLAHRAMYKAAVILENCYQMKFMGWSESTDEQHYNNMGIDFQIFRVLSKDEGREILTDCVEELLKEINSTPELQRFLNPSPFMPANVQIHIYDYQSDRSNLYYPNFVVFSAHDGIVQYKTKVPEMEFGYYTNEKEPYEEAVRIVRSQEEPKEH